MWLLGGGGLAFLGVVGAVLAWGETIKTAFSHWLGTK